MHSLNNVQETRKELFYHVLEDLAPFIGLKAHFLATMSLTPLPPDHRQVVCAFGGVGLGVTLLRLFQQCDGERIQDM